ncbi:hypothetical protein Y032_0115g488 [Ancylostoma ceylanicum]|uniref:LIM zinc-binding domain-containing protein n=2 Tax=Ancylostoma ceylanicum TaxID=53326 RepID=A0A016TCV9_9BILA|nr:hypothetical protein Y032_0115g488 [Ancylostoma ceylanicum]
MIATAVGEAQCYRKQLVWSSVRVRGGAAGARRRVVCDRCVRDSRPRYRSQPTPRCRRAAGRRATIAQRPLRHSPRAPMGKKCEVCKKKCSGDVLKANDKYFHIQCFQCKQCSRPLGESGFYTTADGSYLCPEDFRAIGRSATHRPTVSETPAAAPRPTAVNGEQTINNVKESEQLSPLGSPSGACAFLFGLSYVRLSRHCN